MVITRFAPSPTGDPHIGNIRTALFAWLFARSNAGKFYVRIEDTDKAREVPGSVETILESLEWLGIDYDSIQNSQFSIQNENSKFKNVYFQSHRLAVYKQYAEDLVKRGGAYVCACSPKRLQKLREQQQKEGKASMYDGHCRQIENSKFLIQNSVIRLKVSRDESTVFNDLIRGTVTFENNLIDDQVLIKSDGYPTYHLANVVDDHEMGITHVVRGEDWLPSTPKHILLYRFFGWDIPLFAHLPMILGKDKAKLSKRHGAVSVLEYKSQGYLKEALRNYLALLGWNPGDDREIFSNEELVKQFSLERVQKSPAIFDNEKLEWINGIYIRDMAKRNPDELIRRLNEYSAMNQNKSPLFPKNQQQKITPQVLKLVADRLKKLSEFLPLTQCIYQLSNYDSSLLIFKNSSSKKAQEALTHSLELLRTIPTLQFTEDRLQHYFNHLIAQQGCTVGEVLHPLRVAVTGLRNSPGPFETMAVLKKKETVSRVKVALEKIGNL